MPSVRRGPKAESGGRLSRGGEAMDVRSGPTEREKKLDALIHELARVKTLHIQSLRDGIVNEGYGSGVGAMRDLVRSGRLDDALEGLRELKMQILCQLVLQEPFRDLSGAFPDIDAALGLEPENERASWERPPRGPADLEPPSAD